MFSLMLFLGLSFVQTGTEKNWTSASEWSWELQGKIWRELEPLGLCNRQKPPALLFFFPHWKLLLSLEGIPAALERGLGDVGHVKRKNKNKIDVMPFFKTNKN